MFTSLSFFLGMTFNRAHFTPHFTHICPSTGNYFTVSNSNTLNLVRCYLNISEIMSILCLCHVSVFYLRHNFQHVLLDLEPSWWRKLHAEVQSYRLTKFSIKISYKWLIIKPMLSNTQLVFLENLDNLRTERWVILTVMHQLMFHASCLSPSTPQERNQGSRDIQHFLYSIFPPEFLFWVGGKT